MNWCPKTLELFSPEGLSGEVARRQPNVASTRFFLGTHHPGWCGKLRRPLFLSWPSASKAPDLRPALDDVMEDSGGFNQIRLHGAYQWPAKVYAKGVERHARSCRRLICAFPQDWMTEDPILKKTGPWPDRDTAILEHQRRTVASYLELRSLAPGVPWGLVLQGRDLWHYQNCFEMFLKAGVDPFKAPRVALGSMCKRQDDSGFEIIRYFAGLRNASGERLKLHVLGYKTDGLPPVWGEIESSDSAAWSFVASKRWYIHPGCQHGKREPRKYLNWRPEYGNCANCAVWAEWWADNLLRFVRTGNRTRPPGVEHKGRGTTLMEAA